MRVALLVYMLVICFHKLRDAPIYLIIGPSICSSLQPYPNGMNLLVDLIVDPSTWLGPSTCYGFAYFIMDRLMNLSTLSASQRVPPFHVFIIKFVHFTGKLVCFIDLI